MTDHIVQGNQYACIVKSVQNRHSLRDRGCLRSSHDLQDEGPEI